MAHGGDIYDKKIEYDLSVNLNPNPCPAEIVSALEAAVKEVGRYPDILQRDFRRSVADSENKLLGGDYLTAENILGGNGASEHIFAIIRMINPREVLIPIPGFYGYRHSLNAVSGVNIREYQLKEENGFELPEDFANEITETTDLVILANPNNPTGRAISPKVLDHILEKCQKTGTYVLIDECFLHLTTGAESAAAHISEMPGLFIVNAYTKLFSIPGVRIGYAMSAPENIEKLRAFLPEWNMSIFALKAGCTCAEYIRETDYVKESILRTTDRRQELTALLEKQKIKVYPSDTCYVLLRAEDDLYNRFLDKKILIRDCSDFAGLSNGYFRIAVCSCFQRLREGLLDEPCDLFQGPLPHTFLP